MRPTLEPAMQRRTMLGQRMLRMAATAAATLCLIGPVVPATAEDDPQPVDWPTIEMPGVGDDASDPRPSDWPTVAEPGSDSDEDPTPLDWSAPSPG
jgi:hypothetical protein